MPSDALFFACELLHVSTERYEVLDSGVTIKSFQNRSQNAENEQKGPLFPFAPGVTGAVKAILQNSVRTEKTALARWREHCARSNSEGPCPAAALWLSHSSRAASGCLDSGIQCDSGASGLGIGKHSLEPWHAGANCQNL